MGLGNLSDDELKAVILNDGGISAFLKKPENAAKFMDVNHLTRRRIADILQYDENMDKAKVKEIIDTMAMIRLKEIDVFS